MRSKITIDIDHDNQPIIKIDYVYSEDVRDKMVKRFLETFGGSSSWALFTYDQQPNLSAYGGTDRTAILRPIPPHKLAEEGLVMTLEGARQQHTHDIVMGTQPTGRGNAPLPEAEEKAPQGS